ncbi:MAG: antitoxin family protein [Gemmataceae bacterium]
MTQTIEAIYEQGVFKPLQPVQLPEHLKVMLTVAPAAGADDADADLLQLLDEPFDLGVKGPLTRGAIYDEIG